LIEKKPTAKYISIATILILFVGTVLRLYHLAIVGFSRPWVLGGLYLEFSRQIFQNHYLLPATIPFYTLGGLPFAYPPLPFYIESFLVFTLGLPEFFVVNALPPFISVISLFAFNCLSKKILKNPNARFFSITLFSLLPICYMEQIEGAGLAESFGTLFLIIFLIAFWNYYKNPYHTPKLLLTSFIWALCIMTSPASAYVSVFIFLAIFIVLLKQEKDKINKLFPFISILVFTTILISSIYWGTVIKNHGMDLFIKSFKGQHGIHEMNFFITGILSYSRDQFLKIEFIMPLLFFIALWILLAHKEFGLLFLSIVSSLIPREIWLMGIIGIFVIGIALDLMLQNNSNEKFLKYKSLLRLIFPFVLVLVFLRTYYSIRDRELITPDNSLDSNQIEFLNNIEEFNTSASNLAIIGGETFLEWSPYLSESTVLNEWYGTEFAPEKAHLLAVNDSLVACENYQCVNQILRTSFSGDIFVVIDLEKMKEFEIGEGNDLINKYDDHLVYYLLDFQNQEF